ncbi:MAG TPA: tetratricopeptide repeat protein, partial [Acidobacteriaceae bacterium]|nr:tetratricopeptide repeat protein [Acidobacteriaceae bacterium]
MFADTGERVQDLMERAQAAQQSSNYDEASADYREIIKLKPGWAPAEFNLGMMYFLQKNYPDALDLFNVSLQHQQPVMAAYLFRGIAYFNTGQNERALKSLLKYQELRPNDTQIHTFLAGVYFSLGDYGHAASSYLRQIELTPAEGGNYYHLGECYLSLAREQIKRLNESPHGKYFVWLIAAEAHGRDGGPAAAETYITKAVALDPKSPEAFIAQGQIRLSSRAASEARQSFAEALKRGPTNCRAAEGMVESDVALGDMDQAIASLTGARGPASLCRGYLLVPNLGLSAQEYSQRINALGESPKSTTSKKFVELEIDSWEHRNVGTSGDLRCESSLSYNAHKVDPLLSRASCLEEQGKMREATEGALELATREISDPSVAYRLFGLYMRLSQRSIAKLAELSADSAYITFMNAQVLEQQGKLQEAEAEYGKAISQPDAGPEVLVAYARLLCTESRLNEAIPILNHALKIDPLDQSANALLGEVYFEQNRSDAAIRPLQVAVRLAPGEDQS